MPDRPRLEIVDDDAALRDSITMMLRIFGYQARSWATARAFLEGFAPAECDCVLIDVRMPGMDGLELVAKLRTVAPSMPIILMSGHGEAPVRERARALGVLEFIEKPFDLQDLQRAIDAAIARGKPEGSAE